VFSRLPTFSCALPSIGLSCDVNPASVLQIWVHPLRRGFVFYAICMTGAFCPTPTKRRTVPFSLLWRPFFIYHLVLSGVPSCGAGPKTVVLFLTNHAFCMPQSRRPHYAFRPHCRRRFVLWFVFPFEDCFFAFSFQMSPGVDFIPPNCSCDRQLFFRGSLYVASLRLVFLIFPPPFLFSCA